MNRMEFVRLCVLGGIAGATGVASAEVLPADFGSSLKEAGLTRCKVIEDGTTLRVRCHIGNLDAFTRKAGSLGDGKVKVAGNRLSFVRQNRQISLELIA